MRVLDDGSPRITRCDALNLAPPQAPQSRYCTITTPGRYAYFCDLHATMSGVVVVGDG